MSEQKLSELHYLKISEEIINILNNLKKYIINIEMQVELVEKPSSIQKYLKELYQIKESEYIMDIRASFDKIYVYSMKDKIILNNLNKLREQFEGTISTFANNVIEEQRKNNGSIPFNVMNEILDNLKDNIKFMIDKLSNKSFFDEDF
jgi:hypothetical protein